MNNYILPLIGGAVIGVAISLMLFFNGRVTGVSGIVNGVLRKKDGDFAWRIAFTLGLVSGGFVLKFFYPQAFSNELEKSLPFISIAGVLVGFGTVMGGGCTSGHGICGISRLSLRSVVATLIFMSFGILSAVAFRLFNESFL